MTEPAPCPVYEGQELWLAQRDGQIKRCVVVGAEAPRHWRSWRLVVNVHGTDGGKVRKRKFLSEPHAGGPAARMFGTLEGARESAVGLAREAVHQRTEALAQAQVQLARAVRQAAEWEQGRPR